MPCPRYDFHIHTTYLGCANQTMTLPAIVAECARIGATAIGIADHLNSLDKLDLHARILDDIRATRPGVDVYFGAELNFTSCDGEFAFNEGVKATYGFQFAIGGIHATYLNEFDLGKIIDIQHRHHLRACRDPLVDVLVHPYWFSKGEFDRHGWPYVASPEAVPASYARELGQVARQTGTAIEINSMANLHGRGDDVAQRYFEFLSIVAEQGPMFSVSSDAHDIGHLATVAESWSLADRLGLGEDRIWRPSCEPVVRAAR